MECVFKSLIEKKETAFSFLFFFLETAFSMFVALSQFFHELTALVFARK